VNLVKTRFLKFYALMAIHENHVEKNMMHNFSITLEFK